jgi:beta-phosphoglucomutase-like phosphatase (HAD superfamily)
MATPPAPPAAVLFDLDGTLVDREPLMLESLRRAAADAGAAVTEAEAAAYLGRAWHDVYDGLVIAERTGLGFGEYLDAVVAWSERLVDDGFPVTALSGGRELVERLDQAGIAVGLVTGSLRREALAAVEHLGIAGRLDVFVPAEDYRRGKPAPDAYLLAAERLGVDPVRCVVVEDSGPGIAAGRAAGMWVVATTAANAPVGDPAHQDVSAAHVVLPGLDAPGVWAAVGGR